MEEMIVVVKPGETLPVVGRKIELGSIITERTRKVIVKKIVTMRWHSSGSLIVEFLFKECT